MLSLKKVKGGKVAYIFEGDYADIAIKMFPAISSKVIGIEVPSAPSKERTLSDVASKIEEASRPKLTLNIAKTTAGIPANTDEIHVEIRSLVSELCTRDGLKFGQAWSKAYRMLFDKTGFDVRKAAVVRDRGKPSFIQTVISNGKGPDLIRVLRGYLDVA